MAKQKKTEKAGVSKSVAGGKSGGGAAGTAAGAPIEPDAVLPKSETPVWDRDRMALIVKHSEDVTSLERIEASIQRDIALSGKIDKAGAMVGIKIGLALQSGKALLRHGEYEGWVAAKFGDAFSERKAQYFAKLATAFLRSNDGAQLALPPPKEAGNWLVVSEDGSQLQRSVESFVGDLTLGELLDKHGVRPARMKGGWRPAAWLVKQFQDENKHLANKPFDVWPKEDRDAFMAWQDKELEGDDSAAKRMAAEGTWNGLRLTLNDHGLGRKTYHLIPKAQLQETRDLMMKVLKEIDKVLKEG